MIRYRMRDKGDQMMSYSLDEIEEKPKNEVQDER
jgi:hypothetical protein